MLQVELRFIAYICRRCERAILVCTTACSLGRMIGTLGVGSSDNSCRWDAPLGGNKDFSSSRMQIERLLLDGAALAAVGARAARKARSWTEAANASELMCIVEVAAGGRQLQM